MICADTVRGQNQDGRVRGPVQGVKKESLRAMRQWMGAKDLRKRWKPGVRLGVKRFGRPLRVLLEMAFVPAHCLRHPRIPLPRSICLLLDFLVSKPTLSPHYANYLNSLF